MLLLPVGVDRPLLRKPYVTLALIAVNVLVSLVINPMFPLYDEVVLQLASIPGYNSLLTLFAPMFLHGGFGHLIGNILFFIVAGMKVEDAMGHWRFLLFYLGCGIAADASHSFLSGHVPVPSLGASGAIAGVLGAFMALYPFNRVKIFYWLFVVFHGTFLLSSWIFLGLWFLKEVLSNFLLGGSDLGGGIAFGAHVGGFAAGAVWAWAFWGWNRGPDLDEEHEVGPRSRVIVAPTMQVGGPAR